MNHGENSNMLSATISSPGRMALAYGERLAASWVWPFVTIGRWSETYRVMGLQGAELILIGYNTPLSYAPDPTQNALAGFHNHLVMQAGAYQNGYVCRWGRERWGRRSRWTRWPRA